MRNTYLTLFLLLSFFLQAQTSGVGIGENNPQQKLHLDQTVGTLRVESLDKNNNLYNGGNTNPAGTYPLYVDSNGILSLRLDPLLNSDGVDIIDNATIPQSTLALLTSDVDGLNNVTFYDYTVTVTRPTIMEIKYSISFEVYQNSALTKVKDEGARRISTYCTVDSGTRKYGQTSKCFVNLSLNNPASEGTTVSLGAVGPIYNMGTMYINLTPGTHTVHFNAEVSSNLPSMASFVRLATDVDSIFVRLY